MGGQLACRQVTPGKPGCGLPLRGPSGPGPVRASVLMSRVVTEAGVKPALQNSLCPAGRGEQTPTQVNLRRTWTHWGILMQLQLAS